MKLNVEKVQAEEKERHMFKIILGPHVFAKKHMSWKPRRVALLHFGGDCWIKALRLIKLACLLRGEPEFSWASDAILAPTNKFLDTNETPPFENSSRHWL